MDALTIAVVGVACWYGVEFYPDKPIDPRLQTFDIEWERFPKAWDGPGWAIVTERRTGHVTIL